jgi:ATP-dependent DNA helicase RecQ
VSTFGIGQEHTERVWRSVFRQLVARGLVRIDDYGSLQLVESARPILKGEAQLFLREDLQVTAPRRSSSKKRKSAASGRRTERSSSFKGLAGESKGSVSEEQLRAALRSHRSQLAKGLNLPPYLILHNSTIDEIVSQKPSSLRDLREVPGFGEVKLAKYGEGILEIVRAWLQTAAG